MSGPRAAPLRSFALGLRCADFIHCPTNSVLIHPSRFSGGGGAGNFELNNPLCFSDTEDAYRDHTDRATWMGERYPLGQLNRTSFNESPLCLHCRRDRSPVAMDQLVRPHLAAVAAGAKSGSA